MQNSTRLGHQFNRRSLVTTGSLAGGGALLFGLGSQSSVTAVQDSAGDATPEATPVVQANSTVPPEIESMADTDWVVENRTLDGQRSVAGSSIDSSNVDSLAVSWTATVDTSAAFGALTANPIVSGEMLYLQDASSNVYAMNRESGEPSWTNRYDAVVPSGGPNGIAIGYGVVVYPVGSGLVVAADAETGEERWTTNIQGPRGEGITMAPVVYDNRVYISTIPGSGEAFYKGGMRGVFHVIDITTGEVMWYFDTTTDNLWGNPAVNSGGGLWHPPSIDADGFIYMGIGNAAPYPGTEEYPSGSSRPGDNDYANNLLKLDPDTGELIWSLNVTGRDIFDLDNQNTPVLANVEIGGTSRDIIFTSGKHGFVVAVDPETGSEIWRTPVGTHKNADTQTIPEEETVEVWPGTLGGVETPIAYQDGVVYVPVYELPTTYSPTGIDGGFDFTGAKGKLVALDATDGSVMWEVDEESGSLAGVTVVNDVVFTAALDGVVRAYNTSDGSLVTTLQATAGINAPLAVSGDYLYVPAGGPLIPTDATSDPAPEMQAQLMAFTPGGD